MLMAFTNMEQQMETLSIGQLAKACDVNIQTIRYYERQGLLPEPERRLSGYRMYSPDYVQRIRFIKRAKELGFTLKEISDLLSLRVDRKTSCADVKKRADSKIIDMEEKIQSLQRMKSALEALAATCGEGGPRGECPILEFLEGEQD